MNELPEFIDYMNEKHEEIISSRKNSRHKLCKCGTSSTKESESGASPMRSNGWIEKLKVSCFPDTLQIARDLRVVINQKLKKKKI